MQKICIIGDGLSGLTTANILAKQNIKIDFYCSPTISSKTLKDLRTTAISETNYKYLIDKLEVNKNIFFPIKEVKLFYEDNNKIFNFLNLDEKEKKLMFIYKNEELKNFLNKKLLKNKNIKVIKKKITSINYQKSSIETKAKSCEYDLIILCIGSRSKLYDKITENRDIEKNYKEFSVTTTIHHKSQVISAAQYFLKEGPLAILPIQKNIFSVVWSVDSEFFRKNSKNLRLILKNKIKKILQNIKIIKINNISSFPIFLNLKTKYFKKNVLILGDGLHAIHPMAGQGFNLILRDIRKLESLLLKNNNLGISLKNTYILKDFYNSRKPENTMLSLGINLTNFFFKDRKHISPIRNLVLQNVKNFDFLKKISKKISDTGIVF